MEQLVYSSWKLYAMNISWITKFGQRDEGFVEDPNGQIFWGSRGSGCLFVRQHPQLGFQIFLTHRSAYVEQGNTWGVPGGAVPRGETNLLTSALRETQEEIGSIPSYQQIKSWTWQAPGGKFTFTTFVLKVTDMSWEPKVSNWEVQDCGWFGLNDLSNLNLHFGVRDLLAAIDLMDNNQNETEPQMEKLESTWLYRIATWGYEERRIADPAEVGYKNEWGEHHGPVEFKPDTWNYGTQGWSSPPMPLPKKLYHATPFPEKILQEGFRLPKELGKQMFGGGNEYSAFTTFENAKVYQEVIRDLVRIANGEFDNMDLWSAFQYFGTKWNISEGAIKNAYDMIKYWQEDRKSTSTARGLVDFFGYIHNFEGGEHVPFIFGGSEKTLDNLRGLNPEDVGIVEVETNPLSWHSGANIWNDTDMSQNYTYNKYENEWRIFDPQNTVRPIRRVA